MVSDRRSVCVLSEPRETTTPMSHHSSHKWCSSVGFIRPRPPESTGRVQLSDGDAAVQKKKLDFISFFRCLSLLFLNTWKKKLGEKLLVGFTPGTFSYDIFFHSVANTGKNYRVIIFFPDVRNVLIFTSKEVFFSDYFKEKKIWKRKKTFFFLLHFLFCRRKIFLGRILFYNIRTKTVR